MQIKKRLDHFLRFLEISKVMIKPGTPGDLFDDLRIAWYMSDEQFPTKLQEIMDSIVAAAGNVAESWTIVTRNMRLAVDQVMVAFMTVAQIAQAQQKKIESAATSRKPWPPPGVEIKER